MSFMVIINDNSKRHNQDVGDIICVREDNDPLSLDEKILFDTVEIKDVTKKEIENELNKKKDPDKKYPKFAFDSKTLSTSDKDKFKEQNKKEEKLTLIAKVKLKNPINGIELVTAEKL